jgi:hypothetical protein
MAILQAAAPMSSHPDKPTVADILVTMGKIAAGDWLDPCGAPPHWLCDLYDEHGKHASDGNAFDPAEAMALAWIAVWASDALIDSHVEPGSVPFEIPVGWRFELTPDYVYIWPFDDDDDADLGPA